MMNHEDAIRNQVAASYLLGDLSEADRDAFEEHYFDCLVCGNTVRAGAAMFVNGRPAVQNDPKFQRFRPMKWLSAGAAAAALTVVTTYQMLVMPGLQRLARIETLTIGNTIAGTMRASENEPYVIHFVGKKARVEFVDITDQKYPEYRIELLNAAGELVAWAGATAKEARSSEIGVPLLIRPLPAGRYLLTVRGVRKDGNRPVIDRRSVVVQ